MTSEGLAEAASGSAEGRRGPRRRASGEVAADHLVPAGALIVLGPLVDAPWPPLLRPILMPEMTPTASPNARPPAPKYKRYLKGPLRPMMACVGVTSQPVGLLMAAPSVTS